MENKIYFGSGSFCIEHSDPHFDSFIQNVKSVKDIFAKKGI